MGVCVRMHVCLVIASTSPVLFLWLVSIMRCNLHIGRLTLPVPVPQNINIFVTVFIFHLTLFFLLLCWRYILIFTKVLTIYQKYHIWIHPLHHSPLSSLPHSWNSFSRSHFSSSIRGYTVFIPYSPKKPNFGVWWIRSTVFERPSGTGEWQSAPSYFVNDTDLSPSGISYK
jgi:hypothetical protein